ncbi:Sugar transporter [Rhizoctonia solani]|uniref:Sugar transporter n=1 Tax=Rhizoctonia solani TaxID=456999 RepID=A0A8H7ILN7_9AGAM|nr:Sugar transporter [Rhizoctonia solani]
MEYFFQSLFNAILYGWTPEAFPAPIRGSACGIASFWGRLFSIIAPLIGSRLLDAGGDEGINNVLYLAGAGGSYTVYPKGTDNPTSAIRPQGCELAISAVVGARSDPLNPTPSIQPLYPTPISDPYIRPPQSGTRKIRRLGADIPHQGADNPPLELT